MGFFNKKEKHEEIQTNAIKQATISDTQLNSLNNNNTLKNNVEKNFSNPFTTNNTQTQQTNTLEQTQINNIQAEQQIQNTQTNFSNPFIANNTQTNNIQPEQQVQNTQTNNIQTQQTNTTEQTPTNNTQPEQQIQNTQIQQTDKQTLTKEETQEIIDETIEKLMQEKWKNITTNIEKVLKWKDNVEGQIHMLKEDIVTINDGFTKLESKLINKISNYDRNILDVNSEIKALEKVFHKITPTLINNVNELSKIADNFREGKQIQENKNKTTIDEDE